MLECLRVGSFHYKDEEGDKVECSRVESVHYDDEEVGKVECSRVGSFHYDDEGDKVERSRVGSVHYGDEKGDKVERLRFGSFHYDDEEGGEENGGDEVKYLKATVAMTAMKRGISHVVHDELSWAPFLPDPAELVFFPFSLSSSCNCPISYFFIISCASSE